MSTINLGSLLNHRSGAVIKLAHPSLGSRSPVTDTDMAMIAFTQSGMHLDIGWLDEDSVYRVTLYGNNFESILAQRDCTEVDDMSAAVREFSDQVVALNVARQNLRSSVAEATAMIQPCDATPPLKLGHYPLVGCRAAE